MRDRKHTREVTPEAALAKLMVLASRAEKCSGDAHRLLARWEIKEDAAEAIVSRLIADRYIDDLRYAKAFVRDKSTYSKWGAFKIAQALRAKRVAKETIEEALEELSEERTREGLTDLLQKKMRTLKAASDYELRGKLFRFAASRGYAYDDILAAIEDLNVETEE